MAVGQGQDGKIVTRIRRAFTVAASPLNGVKFELGIILCLAGLAWLLHDLLVSDVVLQLIGLAAYGLAGMLWIILRTRRILRGTPAVSQGREGRCHVHDHRSES